MFDWSDYKRLMDDLTFHKRAIERMFVKTDYNWALDVSPDLKQKGNLF